MKHLPNKPAYFIWCPNQFLWRAGLLEVTFGTFFVMAYNIHHIHEETKYRFRNVEIPFISLIL